MGLGTELPLYASGRASVGWWAMFITMVGDMTAFASLLFGYYFFWTIHPAFPPESSDGPGLAWPTAALAAGAAAWLASVLARRFNARDAGAAFHLAAAFAVVAALGAIVALLLAPSLAGLDPAAHAYPAIVWLLCAWVAAHLAVGILMLLYCVARRLARRMTAVHDIDIRNVVLYWHFVVLQLLATVATIAWFPEVA